MVIVTNTTTTPNVKYITRPKLVGTTYCCDLCSITVTLYVTPTEVTHKCRKTLRPRALKAAK